VILHEWLAENPEFTGRLYWPQQVILTGGIIPDGLFTVAQGDRMLLFLIEVDRGTESKVGTDYSVRRKLIAYGEYFDSGRFAEDYAMLGTFNSFRVVFVSESELALPGLLRIAAETQTDFVYFKPMSKLTPKTFPESWATANQDRADLFGRTERQP